MINTRCFIIKTKLGVQKKTRPTRYSSCHLSILSVSIGIKQIQASNLTCEFKKKRLGGGCRLLCGAICKPVNAAVIKGYDGRGHPAGGLPASTRSGAQRNPFTLHRPPASPLVRFDIHRRTISMKISLGNCIPLCCNHVYLSRLFDFSADVSRNEMLGCGQEGQCF